MSRTDLDQKIIMGLLALSSFSPHEDICNRTSIFDFENRLYDC